MKQLTQHQLRRVYEYLALRCPWAEVTARLIVSTGLPAKELRELTWEQVDFEGKFIRTKDDVYVPINGQTIRTMRRITPFGARVLTMPSGRPIHLARLRCLLTEAFLATGLTAEYDERNLIASVPLEQAAT